MNMSYFKSFYGRLQTIYDDREAHAIALMVFDIRFHLSQVDILLGKDNQLSAEQRHDLENITDRLCRKEPVQYVLGCSFFCDRKFTVGPGVLIPRPETEELVHWIIHDHKNQHPCFILDIGTGSGCIAISLAKELEHARVHALDISHKALDIASRNAKDLKADVTFFQQDILQQNIKKDLPQWHVIVSNPPYICQREAKEMEDIVICNEPHTALFVPDNSPLCFYHSIGKYAMETLLSNGVLYVEINRAYGAETCALFRSLGFDRIELRQDIFGNDRMIKCQKP